MAGKKITKAQTAQIEALGEEEVFALYLECGSTTKLYKKLGELFGLKNEAGEPHKVSSFAFYGWLRSDAERQERWQDLLDFREHQWADEVVDIADNATNETERVDSLRVRAREVAHRMMQGGRQRRAMDTVATTLAQAWLAAVKREDIPEAEWEALPPENPVQPENPVSPGESE